MRSEHGDGLRFGAMGGPKLALAFILFLVSAAGLAGLAAFGGRVGQGVAATVIGAFV